MNMLLKMYYKVFGSRKVKAQELEIIGEFRRRLQTEDQKILDSQLSAAICVQEQAGGAKWCWYYDEKLAACFSDKSLNKRVANVALACNDEGVRMTAKIYTHRGKFFSIEYPKRPSRYKELHGMDCIKLKVVDVNLTE